MRNFSQQKEAYSEPSQTSKSQNLDFHNLDIRHGSEYAYDTSNPPKVFCKKSVLKNFTNLQENNWNGVLFSKVAVLFLKICSIWDITGFDSDCALPSICEIYPKWTC